MSGSGQSTDPGFSLQSAYKELLMEVPNVSLANVLSKVWKLKIPPKAAFMIWRLLQNKLPTADNLGKRNVVLNEQDKLCRFCMEQQETVAHSMFSCMLQIHYGNGVSYDWVWKWLFNPILAHFLQHDFRDAYGMDRNAWSVVWGGSCVECVWRMRNKCVFQGVGVDLVGLQQDILFTIWTWLREFSSSTLVIFDLATRSWYIL